MVAYTFKWPHAGDEVYVTGTFDNWSKSEKMEKIGDKFEKSVDLPDTSDKIYYKFVVDGTWTTNPTDSHEKDKGGNENNVLTPEALLHSYPATVAIMNSVNADATTAQLANDVPLEKNSNKADTEADTATATATGNENGNTNTSDLPGTFPETPADELNKFFGVNPLPAAAGGLNPIKLAPGEPIPTEFKTADTNSNVRLDPESYEKSDALPGVDSRDLSVAPVIGTFIPESSLSLGDGSLHMNSVSADSTTAALAAEVPLEPRVPEVVRESQEKAGVDPEASGIAEEVKEKEILEEELKEKVPEAPTTSEGTAGQGTDKSEGDKTFLENAATTAAEYGAAAMATVVATKDMAVETAAPYAAENLPDSVKEALPTSVQETINASAKENTVETVSPEVPTEVRESIAEAGKSPEAAANTAAVEDKKAVEAELLSEVKVANSVADKVTESEPVVSEPIVSEPIVSEPVVSEPVHSEPVHSEPVHSEPVHSEPVHSEPIVSEPANTEPPKTPVQEAPKVVEPPAAAVEVPEISEPTGNGATSDATNDATNASTTAANGAEPPSTPPKDNDAKSAEALTPGSNKSDKKKNRFSGFFGKIKSKFGGK